MSCLKDDKLIKEQTYTKTEACRLYSGALWILVPNDIKIAPYNFELYRFKFCVFFETQCIIPGAINLKFGMVYYIGGMTKHGKNWPHRAASAQGWIIKDFFLNFWLVLVKVLIFWFLISCQALENTFIGVDLYSRRFCYKLKRRFLEVCISED